MIFDLMGVIFLKEQKYLILGSARNNHLKVFLFLFLFCRSPKVLAFIVWVFVMLGAHVVMDLTISVFQIARTYILSLNCSDNMQIYSVGWHIESVSSIFCRHRKLNISRLFYSVRLSLSIEFKLVPQWRFLNFSFLTNFSKTSVKLTNFPRPIKLK